MSRMTKSLIAYVIRCVLAVVCGGFIACGNNQGGIEHEKMQAYIDSLENVNITQSNQLKGIVEVMGIVSESLDSIAEQERLLIDNSLEGKKLTKEELKANLTAFAELLERYRNKIAMLEDSLIAKGEGLDKLRNIITYLNQQLDEKNKTITALQASVDNKNVDIQRLRKQVTTLTASNEELSSTVQRQGEALVAQSRIINECYIKIGTKKELQNCGILTIGGLLSKAKLNVTNFDKAAFTKVDISHFTEMAIPSTTVQILTQMPKSSYNLTTRGNQSILTITDPTSFWSISNYLVIQIK